MLCSPRRLGARTPARAIQAGREAARHYSAAPPLSSGSKSDDRRDDRPAASSPEPADKSRRLWPHPGRLRSPRAAILTTERLAATTAEATAPQRREPRSRDFASSLLPFNESAAKRRRKECGPRPWGLRGSDGCGATGAAGFIGPNRPG